MIFVERVVACIITLPILGLLGESFGFWTEHSAYDGLVRLVQEPYLFHSLILSVLVASASLILSLYFASNYVEQLFSRRNGDLFQLLILAMPHTALAFGFLLLLSADGVISRMIVSISGSVQPDYLFPRDSFGIGALLSLVVKETIFLTALGMSIAKTLPIDATFMVGRQGGYSRHDVWRFLLWPQIMKRLRPAFFVIFVFGLTNLEVAMILGPDQPQFASIRAYRMLQDPDDLTRQAGALGSLILLVLAILSIWVISRIFNMHLQLDRPLASRLRLRFPIKQSLSILVVSALVALLIWTGVARWPAQQVFPIWSIYPWRLISLLASPIFHTCLIGVLSSIISIAFAVFVLERQHQQNIRRINVVWWYSLWMPAFAFSSGLLAWMFLLGIAPNILVVLVSHVLIGTPFALMMLAESWYSRDSRLILLVAQSGRSKFWVLSRLWIPKMCDIFLLTFAVCFSVSCSLYTQTAILGGGRVTTLMTELVAYGAGDRRLAALAALINTFLPLICFAGSLGFGRILWRHRIGMSGGGFAIVR